MPRIPRIKRRYVSLAALPCGPYRVAAIVAKSNGAKYDFIPVEKVVVPLLVSAYPGYFDDDLVDPDYIPEEEAADALARIAEMFGSPKLTAGNPLDYAFERSLCTHPARARRTEYTQIEPYLYPVCLIQHPGRSVFATKNRR